MKWLDRRIACPGPYLTLCTSQKQFAEAMKHLKAPELPAFLKTKHSNVRFQELMQAFAERIIKPARRSSSRKPAVGHC